MTNKWVFDLNIETFVHMQVTRFYKVAGIKHVFAQSTGKDRHFMWLLDDMNDKINGLVKKHISSCRAFLAV